MPRSTIPIPAVPTTLLLLVLVALGALLAPNAVAAPPHPSLDVSYVCDAALQVTTVRALEGPARIVELVVPGCEPVGRAIDGSPIVSAVVFARLRDHLEAIGRARQAREIARPLGSFAALPADLLPPGLMASPKEGITVEWCGTVVSKDRDDCLGTCSCGNKETGCPCRATKTTSPKESFEEQTN